MTFDERIRKAISDTKTECNYNPKAFIQMVNTYGALETAKRLLASKQNIASGLEKLWELGRLDLCFERIIFEPEWHDLFTKEELTEAKKRLKELNYDVSELSVEPLNKESKLDKKALKKARKEMPYSIAYRIAKELKEATDLEPRVTVLGYLQRGGTPVPYDRVLATELGTAAAHMLAKGDFGKMVALVNGVPTGVSLDKVAGKIKKVPTDHPLLQAAREVGTCFGD